MPPMAKRDQVHDPERERQDRHDERDDQQDAADAGEDPGALRRRDQPHEPQPAQLAVRRRLDTEPLGRLLEVIGAALGERQ